MTGQLKQEAGFTLIELMVVVALIGVLAATATPTFVEHIRSAKVAEVHLALDACYKGVLEYHQKSHTRSDGTIETSKLPVKMKRWVCPGKNFGKQKDLDGDAHLIDPRVWAKKKAQSFAYIGFTVKDPTHACYAYNTNTNQRKGVRDGDWFRCQAITDLDDDLQFAYWFKTGTYSAATGTFQGGAVYKLETGGDW